MLGGEVMEIVDRDTGHISPYPAHSAEFRSMQDQIDRQRRYDPRYRYFYRLRHYVRGDSAAATETAIAIPMATGTTQ